MKKSMATAQMKSTRIALLVLLALAVAAMSEVELLVSTYATEMAGACLLLEFPGMVSLSRAFTFL